MTELMEKGSHAGEVGVTEGQTSIDAGFDSGDNLNSLAETNTVPSMPDASMLSAHIRAGHELIPLSGKKPAEGGWRRNAPLSASKAKARFESGQNIGVRLRDIDLVIDVDPRHFEGGDDPFARLAKEFGLPEAPRVRTGGGGFHYYFEKPADISVVNGLDQFKGIEFKSLGRQVVAAGSVHPETKRRYALDDDPLALSLLDASEAPVALLDAIRKPVASQSDSGFGDIDTEKLAEWLSWIDVADFKDETKWRELMMSCHHGTGGTGIDEFVSWSTSDPEYAHDSEKIRKRWLSLGNRPGAITIRTLIAALPKDKRREATESIGRIPAEMDFPDDTVAVTEDEVSLSGFDWDEWVFVAQAMQFVRRSDCQKYRPEQWRALFASLYPDGEILGAVWKGRIPIKKFESLVYLPEEPEFPDGVSGKRYNIWRKSGVEAKLGDVGQFIEHMAFLFPNEDDRSLVLDYLALLVQRPADKIHFALLIRGAQGTGKSWIGNLMELIIGKPNVVRPSNGEVTSNWTVWMEGAQLAIVEELMMVGRLDLVNKLKTVITDATIRIEEKNCSLYSIPNKLNFLCFTNHYDALKVEHGDRRWLVVFSPATRKEPEYYTRLFGYLKDGGASHVKHWLTQRNIELNSHGVAPPTSGKEVMRRMSMGDAESHLLDLFETGSKPFDFDLVRVEDLVSAVPAGMGGKAYLRSRLAKFLREELSAQQCSRYKKGDVDRPAYQLWSIRKHDVWHNIGAAGRIDAYVAHGCAGHDRCLIDNEKR
jgi:Bifunctional DNA primase/polymerase, N-terminal/Family of unknown function (DUF5906)/Primase C terminal 2 (PriCT-2)